MATINLLPVAVDSNSGWETPTVTAVQTSNNTNIQQGVAGDTIIYTLDDVPTDFGSENSVTLNVECRVSASPTRQKQLTVALLDASNNVLETFSTGNIATSDTLYSSSAFTRSDADTAINAYKIRLTVTESGGMGDSVYVLVDFIYVTLDYNVSERTGSLSKTLANATSSASGAVDITGSLSKTLSNTTSSASGVADIDGSLSKTLGDTTSSGAGQVGSAAGNLSVTLGDMSSTASGEVSVDGASSKTLEDTTSSSSGAVDVSGSVAATLADMSLSASGTVDLTGSATPTLGAMTVTGAGGVGVDGTLSVTLGDMSLTYFEQYYYKSKFYYQPFYSTNFYNVDLGSIGSSAITLGDATLSASGAVDITGTLSKTLSDMSSSATAAVDITGNLSKTLGDVTLEGAGALGDVISGDLSKTLAGSTLSSTGAVDVDGSASNTLGDLALSSDGAVDVDGSASNTLGDTTLESAGSVDVDGSAGIALGDTTLDADGSVGSLDVGGDADVTLQGSTLSATGTVVSTIPVPINPGRGGGWFGSAAPDEHERKDIGKLIRAVERYREEQTRRERLRARNAIKEAAAVARKVIDDHAEYLRSKYENEQFEDLMRAIEMMESGRIRVAMMQRAVSILQSMMVTAEQLMDERMRQIDDDEAMIAILLAA